MVCSAGRGLGSAIATSTGFGRAAGSGTLCSTATGLGKLRLATAIGARPCKSANLHGRAPMAVASLSLPKPVAVEHSVPLPAARPKPVDVAIALPRPRPAEQTIVTASAANNVFENRGYWRGTVEAAPALPAPIAAGTRYQTASAEPVSTGSVGGDALAYASQSETPLAARA